MALILVLGFLSLVVTLFLYFWSKRQAESSTKSWVKAISKFNIGVLAGDPFVWICVAIIFFLTVREIFFGR